MQAGTRRILSQVAIILVALLVLFLVARLLGDVRPDEVLAAIRALPAHNVLAALGLTVFGYCWLIGYDFLALRYLRKQVPVRRLVFTSLSAFALQRNIGPAPLTGGALRYRYYCRHGFSIGDAAMITVLCGFAFTLGIVLTAGLALLLEPEGVARALRLPNWPLRLVGVILLAGLGLFLYWSDYRQHPLRIRSWQAPAPSLHISLAQLLFGTVDVCIVAGVVYLLLPSGLELGYPAFVGLYVLAMLTGALSHVPAGMGVFEAMLLVLLPKVETSELLASLLAFRGIYYLLPLLLMGAATGLYEFGRRLPRPA